MIGLTDKQKVFLDGIEPWTITPLAESLDPTENQVVIRNGHQMTFTGVTPDIIEYLHTRKGSDLNVQ